VRALPAGGEGVVAMRRMADGRLSATTDSVAWSRAAEVAASRVTQRAFGGLGCLFFALLLSYLFMMLLVMGCMSATGKDAEYCREGLRVATVTPTMTRYGPVPVISLPVVRIPCTRQQVDAWAALCNGAVTDSRPSEDFAAIAACVCRRARNPKAGKGCKLDLDSLYII
jgi:hypothetical protein